MLAGSWGIAAFFEALCEVFAGAGPFVIGFGPGLPAGPKLGADAPEMLAGIAAFLDPASDRIFLGEVLVGSAGDGERRSEADLPPFETAVDGPLQDAGPFGL